MGAVKGRLKLPGQEVDIPFTMLKEYPNAFYGNVANTSVSNSFSKTAGWIFEPDAPQLPNVPGWYVGPSAMGDHVAVPGAILFSLRAGVWHADGPIPEQYGTARKWAERIVELQGALIRVKVVEA